MSSKGQVKLVIDGEDNSDRAFKSAKENINKLERAFSGLKGVLAGVAGVGGFGLLIKNALDAGGKIYDLSQRLGVSTEQLSRYQHVAKQSGITFEELTSTWETLNKNAVMAENGLGRARRAFAALFNPEQLKAFNKLSPDKKFESLVQVLMKIEDPAKRNTLAIMAMGEAGAKMFQAFDGGMEQIQKFKDQADRFGLTLSEKGAKALDDAGDALGAVGTAALGAGTVLASSLAPAITSVATAFIECIVWVREHESAFEHLAKIIGVGGALYMGLSTLPAMIKAISSSLAALSAAASASAGALGALRAAGLVLFAAFAGWEIGSWLRENFVEARVFGLQFVEAMLKGWEELKYGAQVAWLGISSAWGIAVDKMRETFAGFIEYVASALNNIPFLNDQAQSLNNFASGLKQGNHAVSRFNEELSFLQYNHKKSMSEITNNINGLIEFEQRTKKATTATNEHKNTIANHTIDLSKLAKGQKEHNKLLEEAKRLTEEVRTPQEVYRDNIGKINQMLEKGYISQETYNRSLGKYKKELEDKTGVTEALKKQKEAYEEHVKEVTNIFKDGLFAFMEEGFDGMVKSFERSLKQMAAEAASQEISKMLFGNAGKGSEGGSLFGFLGSFLGGSSGGSSSGGGFGSFISSIFGGFRAEGGPVQTGKSYVVGENEPELFTPSTSGSITPLSQLAGGGTTIVINNHIQTPNAESFRRAEGNLTARMKMQLDRAGKRNL